MLDVDRAELLDRMRHREHFMPPSLLDSQLATLEPLEPRRAGRGGGCVGRPVEETVAAALAADPVDSATDFGEGCARLQDIRDRRGEGKVPHAHLRKERPLHG